MIQYDDISSTRAADRCLPSESTLVRILNSIHIENPFSHPAPNILLSNREKQPSADFAESTFIDMATTSPVATFRSPLVTPVCHGPSQYSRKANRSYHYSDTNEKRVNDSQRPYIASWNPQLLEDLEKVGLGTSMFIETKVKRNNEIDYSLVSPHKQFMDRCELFERFLFVTRLREAGHIQTLDEVQLRAEVKSRQRQYPGQPIYLLAGNELGKYLAAVHPTTNRLETAKIYWAPVRADSYYNDNEDYQFGKYEVAVICPLQVKANRRFLFDYTLRRVDRGWQVYMGGIMYTDIIVTPREVVTKDIIVQPTLF